ncbi:MAG: hypothetical protein RML46_03455 [Anaerolineae bacterium]|nr:hypothetical protein [Anaerolineae bacterium]MDW8067948.1 hypothetical protein [Anaerolineae bacterium]
MSERRVSLDYLNSIVYDLEKAFWDERGKGARFRVTTVGRDYFLNKCLPRIQQREIEPIIEVIQRVLKKDKLVAGVSHQWEDKLLRIQVRGCLHGPVEERLVAKGVEPFTCVPANLIVLAIEEVLDRPAELAEIRVEGEACNLLLVVFDARPTFE